MISSNIIKISPIRLVGHRLLASQAAHKTESHHHNELKPEQIKVKTLPSGLTVISQENYSPLTKVAICIRAGSRYEPEDELGLSHTLRNAAGLSTKRSTVFGITRNIEFVGGRFYTIATRDLIIYVLENIRDYTKRNLDFLSDTIMEPAFKPWELSDFAYRQKVDLALLNETPQLKLIEALHKAAYRGGLANSIFTPDYMVGKHTQDMLSTYVKDHFVANRTSIVGLGVQQDRFIDFIAKNFSLPTGDRGRSGESKYVGGEIRIDTNSNTSYVAVAAEGVGAKNRKDLLALQLFQTLLGSGPRVKYGLGTATILGQAAEKVAEQPFAVNCLNINHSDSGLFGFCVAANHKEIHKIVKAVASQLRESAKKITEQDLKNAKNSLKATILLSLEKSENLLEDLGSQALTGQVLVGSELEKAIDSISLQDVTNLTSKIIKGKGAMASIGKSHNNPYLEDLL